MDAKMAEYRNVEIRITINREKQVRACLEILYLFDQSTRRDDNLG